MKPINTFGRRNAVFIAKAGGKCIVTTILKGIKPFITESIGTRFSQLHDAPDGDVRNTEHPVADTQIRMEN
jgi:hypothetical protein